MVKYFITFGVLVLTGTLGVVAFGSSSELFAALNNSVREERSFTSPALILEREYPSMEGPYHSEPITLLDDEERERLWLLGGEIHSLDAQSGLAVEKDYFCHSHIRFDMRDEGVRPEKALTFVQGSERIAFSAGFGFPVYSDEPLVWLGMAMSPKQASPKAVQQKLSLSFIRDSKVRYPLKPLFRRALSMGIPRETVSRPRGAERGSSAASRFVSHWLVPPGRDERVVEVTERLELPFDTTVHYAHAHLHPYGSAVRLRDLTTGEIVLEMAFVTDKTRRTIREATHYASSEGRWLYRGHRYQLESVYENSTEGEIDAMAMIYLYLYDRDSS